MAWVKVDDQFFFKPRARQAGKDGRALFWAGLCYCAANRTDGRVVHEALPFVASMAEVEQDIAHLLVNVGLWSKDDEGFEVIDFLKFNPSRAQLEAESAAAAERQARSREKSRRDSHRDTDVTSSAPSPSPSPVPSPTDKSSSSSSSVTETGLPPDLWKKVAEKQAATTTSQIGNIRAWTNKAAENARADLTERAVWLVKDYDLTTSQLVDVLVLPKNPPWLAHHKRKATA